MSLWHLGVKLSAVEAAGVDFAPGESCSSQCNSHCSLLLLRPLSATSHKSNHNYVRAVSQMQKPDPVGSCEAGWIL